MLSAHEYSLQRVPPLRNSPWKGSLAGVVGDEHCHQRYTGDNDDVCYGGAGQRLELMSRQLGSATLWRHAFRGEAVPNFP